MRRIAKSPSYAQLGLRRTQIAASYHNTLVPTLMRGRMKYQRSHHAAGYGFCELPKCPRALAGIFRPAAVHGIPVLPLQPNDISARSKWVPTKIDLGSWPSRSKIPSDSTRRRSGQLRSYAPFSSPSGRRGLRSLRTNPSRVKCRAPTLYTSPDRALW